MRIFDRVETKLTGILNIDKGKQKTGKQFSKVN